MENEKKTEVLEVTVMQPEQFSILEGLEKKQNEIVKQFPFVAITDKKTYEDAKRHRTALLTASTTVEKDEKTFGKAANDLIKKIREKVTSYAKITRDEYDKQQAEVERYEKILQEELDRKAKIAKEREDGIKANIQTLIDGYNAEIEKMTFETIASTKDTIGKSISEHRGTFHEFDILFNRDVESTWGLYDYKVKSVTEAHENAEIDRKKAHNDKIAEIDLMCKTIVLELTPDNFEEKQQQFQDIVNQDYDFEEFKPKYSKKLDELSELFLTRSVDIEQQAKEKKKAEADRKELEELRAKKVFTDRCAKLKEIGMIEAKNGDFQFFDLTYTKADIEKDEQEIFDQTAENIERFIESENNKPEEVAPAIEEVVAEQTPVDETEIPAGDPSNIHSDETTSSAADIEVKEESIVEAENPAQAGNGIAKFNDALEILETAPQWEKLSYIETVGQLKGLLSRFSDDTVIGFIDQPQQALCVMLDTTEDKTLLGFKVIIEDISGVFDGK